MLYPELCYNESCYKVVVVYHYKANALIRLVGLAGSSRPLLFTCPEDTFSHGRSQVVKKCIVLDKSGIGLIFFLFLLKNMFWVLIRSTSVTIYDYVEK